MVPKKELDPTALGSAYLEMLSNLKDRINKAKQRAVLKVNQELIILYWDLGKEILVRELQGGWGSKVVVSISHDLRREFPEMSGFSPRNLEYMKTFAQAYPDLAFLQQVVAKLPWGHHVRILDHIKDPQERGWYVHAAIVNGWSRNVLVHQMGSDLYHRQGRALTNFDKVLPAQNSELAHQTFKDPYIFDFLDLGPQTQERELERAILDNIRDFLLELGTGFSFVGSQYHLEVASEDFYIDLLFYHLKLRCFVVVDLKVGQFEPEFAGKMNFYLSAVDEMLRHPEDRPTIGLILCKTQNRLVAEYTMRDINKPLGVATYQLPSELKDKLPSLEMFEQILKKKKNRKR